MRNTKILATVGVSFMMIAATAMSGCSFFDTPEDDGGTVQNSGKLHVEGTPQCNSDYTNGLGYSVTVTGILKNDTKKDYSYVSITYTLYDAEGNNIGTALDNTNYLSKGESWRFSATTLGWVDVEPVSYKCSNITAF